MDQSKIHYLHNVNGNKIVEIYNKFNVDPNRNIIATQIHPTNTKDTEELPLYDVFIYYKEKEQQSKIDLTAAIKQ